MHELSIAQGIVTVVDEAARGRRIACVNVEIGAVSGVAPDAIAFSFDLVARELARKARGSISLRSRDGAMRGLRTGVPDHGSLYRMLVRLLSQNAAARWRA